MTAFVSGLRQQTPPVDGRIRLWLVSDNAARGCRAACGQYPPPPWLGIASTPDAVLAIAPPAKVFAIRFGHGLDAAWHALRRRYWTAECAAGLTDDELARLAAWRLRNAPPGVLPASVDMEGLGGLPEMTALGGIAGVAVRS